MAISLQTVVLIILALVAFCLVIVLVVNSKYGKLLSAKHLCEISSSLRELKASALQKKMTVDNLPDEEAEPAYIQTSGKLLLAYSILQEDSDFIHHISISHESGLLALSGLSTIASWLCYFLRLEPGKVKISAVATSPIYHMEFKIRGANDELEYETKPVLALTAEAMTQDLWKQLEPGRQLILQQLQTQE